jgi:hypothetical protein
LPLAAQKSNNEIPHRWHGDSRVLCTLTLTFVKQTLVNNTPTFGTVQNIKLFLVMFEGTIFLMAVYCLLTFV